ncbi:MAG: serine/threonine protein kinase [Betaproteobacteria bacterium]|nr:serine/threonine protein kinase [Betaproteobacteria bacterium]
MNSTTSHPGDEILPRRDARWFTPGRIALVLLSAALLLGLGYWTYTAVEGSLRELRAGTMKSLLDAQVNALRVWLREEIGDAERIAREPGVQDAVAKLAAVALRPDAAREELCGGPARARVEEVLRPLLREVGDSTFNVTAPDGRLLATRFPEYCGLRVTEKQFRPLLEPVFRGESRFIRPYRDADRVESPPRLREGQAFGWIATPVHAAGGQVIAALGIAEPADGVLSAILAAAHPGETGELFAFDERNALLTRSRFDGNTRFTMPGAGPGARAGSSLEPYRNDLGVEVVGAWRWVEDLGLGVAIEIGAAEAYAPLSYLRTAFGIVFGALVIAVAAALWSGISLLRLRGELGGQRKVGAYRLERSIGEGGMANVYLARHDLLKRPCAVKLLKPARASDEMIARFEREVQLASQLSHSNVVEIYDYGRSADGLLYYAMEYLDGINLGELVEREGKPPACIPVARAVRILRQLCAGLTVAHAAGLVHRDIKPENIMLCQRGGERDLVKILDFGLVKSVTAAHSRDLTRNLRILGTPLYMSPERLRDPADVDARADIYAVGAVAFYLLTGKKIFEGTDDLALTSKILNEEPPLASKAACQPIPVELDLLVQACLEKRREDRPQRVADLVEALDALS